MAVPPVRDGPRGAFRCRSDRKVAGQPQCRKGAFVTPRGSRLPYEAVVCPVLDRDGKRRLIFGGKFFPG